MPLWFAVCPKKSYSVKARSGRRFLGILRPGNRVTWKSHRSIRLFSYLIAISPKLRGVWVEKLPFVQRYAELVYVIEYTKSYGNRKTHSEKNLLRKTNFSFCVVFDWRELLLLQLYLSFVQKSLKVKQLPGSNFPGNACSVTGLVSRALRWSKHW